MGRRSQRSRRVARAGRAHVARLGRAADPEAARCPWARRLRRQAGGQALSALVRRAARGRAARATTTRCSSSWTSSPSEPTSRRSRRGGGATVADRARGAAGPARAPARGPGAPARRTVAAPTVAAGRPRRVPDYFAFEAACAARPEEIRERQRALRRRLPRRRRPCSTSAAAAASSSGSCARRASRRAASTPTRTWSPSAAARGWTSSRLTRSRTSRRSRRARSAGSSPAQVVEHLPPRRARCGCSSWRLRSSGPAALLVAETINPLSPLALTQLLRRPHARPAARARDARPARPPGGLRAVETRYLNEPARAARRCPRRSRRSPRTSAAERDPLRAAGLRDRRARHEDRGLPSPGAVRTRAAPRSSRDELVAELRDRGHEAELVSVPFKWYPGRARADPGVPLAAARPDRGGRAADRPRDRHEVPLLLRPPPEQGRLARCTSSGRRTSSTAPSSASSSESPRTGRRCARVQRLDRRRARRGAASCSPPRATSPSGSQRSTGLDAEVLPHPPQELAYRTTATATSSSRSAGSTAPSGSTC